MLTYISEAFHILNSMMKFNVPLYFARKVFTSWRNRQGTRLHMLCGTFAAIPTKTICVFTKVHSFNTKEPCIAVLTDPESDNL